MQYAPPSDLDELDEYLASARGATTADVLAELRAYVRETATLHAHLADLLHARDSVVAGIPVYSFHGGVVLAACERTYELRQELRALGGEWRVVPTQAGKVLGWAFADERAAEVLELISRRDPAELGVDPGREATDAHEATL